MAYATFHLPSIEEARERLHDHQLAVWSTDGVLVGTGQYVFRGTSETITAELSMLMHGYTLDFSGAFVKLIP